MEEYSTETGTDTGMEGTPADGYQEPETETELEPETETELETEPEPETETELETEPEPETGTETEAGTETDESGDISYDDTDGTSADTPNTESGASAPSGSPESGADSADGTDGTPDDAALLERLDALVEALTPDEEQEAGELEGAETEGNEEPEISAYDSETFQTLQGIQSALVSIQAENELWHTETLAYRKEAQEAQKSIMEHLEFISLLLIAAGFFTALLCGGKFADIFFKRMKGEGDRD